MLEVFTLVNLAVFGPWKMGSVRAKLVRKFDNSIEALTDLWKNKYAKKRIASLIKQERVSKETHFYDDIIYLTWEETKTKYLPQVGR